MSRRAFLCGVLVGPLVLWLAVSSFAQSTAILGPSDAIAFDYLDADLTAYSVNDFQASWDGGAWQSIGIATAFRDANTQAGASSYKALPPFTSGQHQVSFRACNSAGCGGGSSPFPFAYASAPASSPSNVRVVPR